MRLKTALCAALMLVLGACSNPAQDKAFDAKVRGYLLSHPELLIEMQDRLQAKQREEAANAAKTAIRDNRMAIERDSRDIVINPKGRITVVEFFDYQCGYCKLTAPEVVALVQKNPDVRLVLKDFVIFGAVSDYAAKAVLTTRGSGKDLALFQQMMAEKPLSEEAVDRILAANGFNPAAIRLEIQKPQYSRQIADVQALAHDLRLDGTPAFIIGDTLVPGADMKAVEKAIAKARKG